MLKSSFEIEFYASASGIKLTHWGRVTHICVSDLTNIGSDNGLSPGRRQAIIWTNAGVLLIGPLGTNFSKILIGIQTFSFNKLHLKKSSAKWRLFCLGLNELRLSYWWNNSPIYRKCSISQTFGPAKIFAVYGFTDNFTKHNINVLKYYQKSHHA